MMKMKMNKMEMAKKRSERNEGIPSLIKFILFIL